MAENITQCCFFMIGPSQRHSALYNQPVPPTYRRFDIRSELTLLSGGEHEPREPIRQITPTHVVSLHYVVRGAGCLRQGNQSFPVKAGGIFALFPGTRNEYGPIGVASWRYYFVSFSGPSAAGLCHRLGLDLQRPARLARRDPVVEREFEDLLRHRRNPSAAEQPGFWARFFSIVDRLSRETAPRPRRSRVEERVERARDLIESTYWEPLAIARLADFAGVERSYFFKKFKAVTGKSPRDYLRDYRLERAKEALLSTGLSVGEIGDSVGYRNYFSFARAFHQGVGRSPTSFRKSAKEIGRFSR